MKLTYILFVFVKMSLPLHILKGMDIDKTNFNRHKETKIENENN